MNPYLLLGGFLWFITCMIIGTSNQKNQWGSCAVENYCNANEDRFKQITWTSYGVIGLVIFIVIGGML